MTYLKISALVFITHIAINFDLGAGVETIFVLNSTNVEDRDMTCSIDGSGDDSQIEGIFRIDIFGILENADERLATVNLVSPNVVKPGQGQILQSFGSISGKEGFLRLKMKADKRVLKYSCRAVLLDKDLNHITMEKLQTNKANVLMSMLNQRFAGLAPGMDFKDAFKKLEDKFTGTQDLMAEEMKMEIARSLNVTKKTVAGVFETVRSNGHRARRVIDKVSKIEMDLTSLFRKVDAMSVLLQAHVNQSMTAKLGLVAESCDDFRSSPDSIRLSRFTITTPKGHHMMCDPVTSGGGWTVFQRRVNGDVNFNRTWSDYENGFGSVHSSFWMGLRRLSSLVAKGRWDLRVDMEYNGKMYYAEYGYFRVSDSSSNYKLSLFDYTGTAGDSLAYHSKMPFSTPDRDNDKFTSGHCAQLAGAGWWYKHCDHSNLNGQWGSKEIDKGVNWDTTTTYEDSASFTEMKVRKVQ